MHYSFNSANPTLQIQVTPTNFLFYESEHEVQINESQSEHSKQEDRQGEHIAFQD